MTAKSGIVRVFLAFAIIVLVPGAIVFSVVVITMRGIRKLRRGKP